jgi:hypothetical protein
MDGMPAGDGAVSPFLDWATTGTEMASDEATMGSSEFLVQQKKKNYKI